MILIEKIITSKFVIFLYLLCYKFGLNIFSVPDSDFKQR